MENMGAKVVVAYRLISPAEDQTAVVRLFFNYIVHWRGGGLIMKTEDGGTPLGGVG